MKKVLVIALVFLVSSGCRNGHGRESKVPAEQTSKETGEGQLKVTLSCDKEAYKHGELVEVTYTIENRSDEPVTIIDWSFVFASIGEADWQKLFTRDLIWRADWRESKSDYKTIEPHGKITHTYSYSIQPYAVTSLPAFPWKVKIQFRMARSEKDNFYYDFEHEHIQATTKIPIEAWTGTLNSNIITINITGS